MTPTFETIFADDNLEVINALATAFGRNFAAVVRFVPGNIFSCGPGALVSPTNSKGDMSGGFDLQLRTMFPSLEDRLQEYIRRLSCKRLSVGTVVWIETGDEQYPVVIFAPTFRDPWDLASLNRVSRAAFAVFSSVQAHNASGRSGPIRRVLVPGFGTGVGGLDPASAAQKIFRAYRRAFDTPVRTVTMPPPIEFPG